MKLADVEYIDTLLANGLAAFTPKLESGTDPTMDGERTSVGVGLRGLMDVLKLEMTRAPYHASENSSSKGVQRATVGSDLKRRQILFQTQLS